MPENSKFTPADITVLAVVGVTAVIAGYGLTKLALDWTREGVRTIKEKKSSND